MYDLKFVLFVITSMVLGWSQNKHWHLPIKVRISFCQNGTIAELSHIMQCHVYKISLAQNIIDSYRINHLLINFKLLHFPPLVFHQNKCLVFYSHITWVHCCGSRAHYFMGILSVNTYLVDEKQQLSFQVNLRWINSESLEGTELSEPFGCLRSHLQPKRTKILTQCFIHNGSTYSYACNINSHQIMYQITNGPS